MTSGAAVQPCSGPDAPAQSPSRSSRQLPFEVVPSFSPQPSQMQKPLVVGFECFKGLSLHHLQQIRPARRPSLSFAFEGEKPNQQRSSRMLLAPTAAGLCCQRIPSVWAVFNRWELNDGHRVCISTEQSQQSGVRQRDSITTITRCHDCASCRGEQWPCFRPRPSAAAGMATHGRGTPHPLPLKKFFSSAEKSFFKGRSYPHRGDGAQLALENTHLIARNISGMCQLQPEPLEMNYRPLRY